jgi:hypothetical protein
MDRQLIYGGMLGHVMFAVCDEVRNGGNKKQILNLPAVDVHGHGSRE